MASATLPPTPTAGGGAGMLRLRISGASESSLPAVGGGGVSPLAAGAPSMANETSRGRIADWLRSYSIYAVLPVSHKAALPPPLTIPLSHYSSLEAPGQAFANYMRAFVSHRQVHARGPGCGFSKSLSPAAFSCGCAETPYYCRHFPLPECLSRAYRVPIESPPAAPPGCCAVLVAAAAAGLPRLPRAARCGDGGVGPAYQRIRGHALRLRLYPGAGRRSASSNPIDDHLIDSIRSNVDHPWHPEAGPSALHSAAPRQLHQPLFFW